MPYGEGRTDVDAEADAAADAAAVAVGVEEVLAVAIVAAVTFALLDLLAPSIGLTARQGAGFGLGANLVGFPRL